MKNTIDYYFDPASGYAYLGHGKLIALTKRFEANLRFCPIDIARVYSASQTVPPARQSPTRQRYRIADMQRCAEHLNLPIKPIPEFWPVNPDLACRAILAAKALQFDLAIVTHAIFRGVWVLDENISDEQSLIKLLNSAHLPGQQILSRADKGSVHREALDITQQAIDAGVFGSPSYIYGESLFWGQDRLNQLELTLLKKRGNLPELEVQDDAVTSE